MAARHAANRQGGSSGSRRVAWLLAAVAVLVVVAGVLVARTVGDGTVAAGSGPGPATSSAATPSQPGQSSTPSPATASRPSPASTPTAPGGAPAVPAALVRCRDGIATAQAAIDAGHLGVRHWQEHVQAQTDLDAGRNTPAQTKAIFTRTRLAGPGDLAQFAGPYERFRTTPAACRDLGGVGAPFDSVATACAARGAAASRAAAATKAVIDDWARHQMHMRESRAGMVGPMQAQARWLADWRASAPALRELEIAMRALDAAPQCQLPAAS